MYKTNFIFTALFTLLVTSSLLFYNWYFNEEENKYFQSKTERMITKHSPQAPVLVSLYNVDKDPHDNFISAKQCLVCHQIGIEIKRDNLNKKNKAPQASYKCQILLGNSDCLSCHKYE